MTVNKTVHIFITAGEDSGDLLGARLMRALKSAYGGEIRFSGIGGALMQAEGLESLFPMNDLAVMGITEVLPQLKLILKRIEQTADKVEKEKPDIVITIDAPDFSFRVAKQVRKRGSRVKMVHYVAPTVWAWRAGRAAKVAKLYDGVMCLYPMEPAYFEKEGISAAFTGHPALEHDFGTPDQEVKSGPALGLLFGSRRGELKRIGPVMRDAARRFLDVHPDVAVIVPTLPHIEDDVRALVKDLPCAHLEVTTDKAQKYKAFSSMNAALAVSGTVALELAVAGVPHVIGYKVNALSAAIARGLLRISHVHMVNILLARPAIPEFLQEDCTPANLAAALETIWQNPEAQRTHFENFRGLIGGSTPEQPPSMQAASFIIGQLP